MRQEQWEEGIKNICDAYLEEALDHSRAGRRRHPLSRLPGIAAAIVLCLLFGGLIFSHIRPDKLKSLQDSTGSGEGSFDAGESAQAFSFLTIVAYASTDAAEGEEMETEKKVISDCSPISGSAPAMPFSFAYESGEGDVTIQVSAEEGGTLQTFDTDEFGTRSAKEIGRTLRCAPDEKVYWCPSDTFDQKSGITVEVVLGGSILETKYISIEKNGDSSFCATLENKTGAESKGGVLREAMKSSVKPGPYAPELCTANESYLSFANLSGMIIYDLKKDEVASVIDLQEIDCNNFNSDNRHTKVLPMEDGMLLFNTASGKAEDTYYECTFEEGLQYPHLIRRSRKETGEDLIDRYKKYRKKYVNQSNRNTVYRHVSKETRYSEFSISYGSGTDRTAACLLTRFDHTDEQNSLYAILNENMTSGKVTIKDLNINAVAEPEQDSLPTFQYRGKSAYKTAIYNYWMTEISLDEKRLDESVALNGVWIPYISRIYGRVETRKKLVLFCTIMTEYYVKTGNILESQSGGGNYVKFTLRKSRGGYVVEQAEIAQGDGGMLYDSWTKMLSDYPKFLQSFRNGDIPYDQKKADRENAHVIRQYVKNNRLDIQYYKDYGWDKVAL